MKIEKPSPKYEGWNMEPQTYGLMRARASGYWAGCLDVEHAYLCPGKESDTAWMVMGYDSRRKHRRSSVWYPQGYAEI